MATKIKTRDLYLRAPRGSFELSEKGTRKGLYKKELAYPGHFVKMKQGTNEPEFELPVDEELIRHWVKTFKKMKGNGIDVPMPIGHTTNPEQRRGTAIDLVAEPNPERGGALSLYAYCKFNDDDSAKTFKHSNVSLFMPPDFTDGKGNKYIRPIRHVAITDYPVIPGLAPFKPVAASFELSLAEETESDPMLRQLADKLGIEVPEDADDEQIAKAIEDAWTAGEEPDGDEGEGEEGEELPEDEEGDDAGFADEDSDEGHNSGGEIGDTGFADEEADEENENFPMAGFEDEDADLTSGGSRRRRTQADDSEGAPPELGFSHEAAPIPASFVRREADHRVAQLKGLVKDRKISPAAASAFAKMYAGREHVGYALSLESMGEEHGDNFDDVYAALSLLPSNRVGSVGEKTRKQTFKSADKSPLVKNAAQRAKKK